MCVWLVIDIVYVYVWCLVCSHDVSSYYLVWLLILFMFMSDVRFVFLYEFSFMCLISYWLWLCSCLMFGLFVYVCSALSVWLSMFMFGVWFFSHVSSVICVWFVIDIVYVYFWWYTCFVIYASSDVCLFVTGICLCLILVFRMSSAYVFDGIFAVFPFIFDVRFVFVCEISFMCLIQCYFYIWCQSCCFLCEFSVMCLVGYRYCLF